MLETIGINIMTIKEYTDILLENDIIKVYEGNLYRFTTKGFELLNAYCPNNYPSSWYNAIDESDNTFWGIRPGYHDPSCFHWFSEDSRDYKEVMENTLTNVFKIDLEPADYIELDDIVL